MMQCCRKSLCGVNHNFLTIFGSKIGKNNTMICVTS